MVVLFMFVIVGVAVAVRMGVAVMIVFVVDVLYAWGHRYFGRGLRIELLAEQQHQGGAEQREQGYQPDLIEKVHVTTSAGRSGRQGPSLCCGIARLECPGPPPLPLLRR